MTEAEIRKQEAVTKLQRLRDEINSTVIKLVTIYGYEVELELKIVEGGYAGTGKNMPQLKSRVLQEVRF